MTVNPSDGHISWHYTSGLWLYGNLGTAESGNDYISDDIRHMPIKRIKITSENSAKAKAYKTWTLLDDYKDMTFYELMFYLYNESPTSDEDEKIVPSSGFEQDPIM